MRSAMLWAGAVWMVLLVGVAIDANRVAPSPIIAQSMPMRVPEKPSANLSANLAPYVPSGVPTGAPEAHAIQSAVLLQAVDCSGNLRMLHLLHRPSVRDRLQLAVLWYVGSAQDTVIMRRLLPSWTATIPLRAVPPAVLTELARLGHTSTPTLVVLDQHRRVRFTTQSPRSPREYAGLRRIIEGLTWIEDL